MRKLLLTVAAAIPASAIAAQTPAVRLINAPDASSQHVFGTVAAVRQLPGGKLLVNDIVKRQLTLLDPALGSATIIADSLSGTANSYGVRPGGLIAYYADSTLFVDPAGLSMFVIDPAGKIARVASVPRSQDAGALGSNLLGNPALDGRGRLVYRGGFGRVIAGPAAVSAVKSGAGGGDAAARATSLANMFEQPDTTALVRVDLATRKLDTAAFFKIPKNKMNVQQSDKGIMVSNEINPLQTVDDWAVLADGSIALIRGQDYHVDFIHPDGSVASSPKIPYDWQRLTDEDKVAIIDSAKTAFERARAAAPAGGNAVMAGPGGGAPGGGMVVMNFRMGDGAAGGGVKTGDAGSGPQVNFVSANELPDYRPVFAQGSSRGDADGNLWVRTSATRAGSVGGPIYDVIGQHGELVERVQIPSGRQIVGFGKGGVVYMVARDDSGAWLERTHR
jgi:hypothetical protein